jgi:hypothetical protein
MNVVLVEKNLRFLSMFADLNLSQYLGFLLLSTY